ncbi:MAG: ring-cleaving dioxygenase [Parachlamydiaceae bacterium]|nr:ring-cleaving dioxygenase [Parachlamydiaceae bacterium]
MNKLITGLHHITALASDAQKNIDFYAGILGLRLVKKTINFDAPDVYHLYYGNEKGSPGTILTFFPYSGIPQGRKGKGQLTVTSFSIPENAMDYWINRLDKFSIAHEGPQQRFDELFVYFEDHDGLGLELVSNKDERPGFTYGHIPPEFAIKGFYGITLSEECYEKTAGLLVGQMDHTLIAEKDNRFRYSASGKPGDFVDVLCNPDTLIGLGGYGTIHHVAFATANDNTQLEAREKLLKVGLNVTPVLDRQYFHSIYFREPGSVLFEIATVPPGFTVDEPLERLGESLKLPLWQEQSRAQIEKKLSPIQLDINRYFD